MCLAAFCMDLTLALSSSTALRFFGLESPHHPCEDQGKSRQIGVIALAGIFSFVETASAP